jgi:hypothetical protein
LKQPSPAKSNSHSNIGLSKPQSSITENARILHQFRSNENSSEEGSLTQQISKEKIQRIGSLGPITAMFGQSKEQSDRFIQEMTFNDSNSIKYRSLVND